MGCVAFIIGLTCLGAAEHPGQIAYLSGTGQEDRCVCILDLASGAVTRVGTGACDGGPVWSPDGARLAFSARVGDGLAIHTVRADGTELRSLPHAKSWSRWPRWSPDGTRLAYNADDGAALSSGLMVYDLATDTETPWAAGETGFLRPVWTQGIKFLLTLKQIGETTYGESSIAALIADFQDTGALLGIGLSGKPGAYSTDLFLASSSGMAPLVPPALNRADYIEWAVEPNAKGDMIAFESNDGGNREIFLLSKLGMTDLSNHRAVDWNPVWAPDGKWLAFESLRSGRRGLFRVYPETIRVLPVAVSEKFDNWAPTWSPDGAYIAFVSDRTGDAEIYVTDLTGEHCRRLTEHPGPDLAPAWRPRGAP